MRPRSTCHPDLNIPLPLHSIPTVVLVWLSSHNNQPTEVILSRSLKMFEFIYYHSQSVSDFNDELS